MLRGENIACGTSTTGTGTLTLAACPAAVGALDFDKYLKGASFVSGNAVLVPYTIIEYTSSTFATPSQIEKGIGTVTLGAAIANATLARTTVQVTQVGTTYDDSAPSAITIGTAANTLIFIGASAADIPAFPPYFDSALGDGAGLCPMTALGNATAVGINSDGTGTDWYVPAFIAHPILVKRATIRVTAGYAGSTGTPISEAYFRIYAVNTSGRPGKLLIDLGALGGANPLNSANTNIQTAAHASGIFLPPGVYFGNVFATWSGATGTVTQPTIRGIAQPISTGLCGTSALSPILLAKATGGTSTASDPANVASYGTSNQTNVPIFALKDS